MILAGAGGYVWSVGVKSRSESNALLRPPGARSDFLAKCIKCGLCVRYCPYHSLKLAELGEAKVAGTPYIVPREIPCYLCEDIPCAKICPSEALDIKALSSDGKPDIKKVKIGLAVVDSNSCVAYFGIQCDACYRACPFIDKALRLEYRRNERTSKHAFLLPVIDPTYCVGCGKCERACITQKAAIFVLPRDMALGVMGENYVIGWDKGDEEKLKNAPTNRNLDAAKAIDYLNGEEF